MRRSPLTPLVLVATLLANALILASPTATEARLQAEDEVDIDVLMDVMLEQGGIPIAPAFVRLLRINLEPGASVPAHTHPGPEFGRIESGTLAVTVRGRALLWRATTDDEPATVEIAPEDEEFILERGDLIVYLPQTEMAFRNPGSRTTRILAAVILPAGHQHPPGITYVGGQPSADAFIGVTPEILGDGIATVLPRGRAIVRIERLTLGPGQPIPAVEGPVLLSVVKGVLDFTVVSGRVQISRTANPGPQPEASPGTAFSLAKGDAAFFPIGIEETPRFAEDGELVLYRMTIDPAGDDATPAPISIEEVGVLAIATPSVPPTPEATEGAEPTATPEPTPTPQLGKFSVGDQVVVTEDGVRLRTGPSTDDEIITGLVQGQVLVVTGPPEEGSGFVWWPVEDVNDPSLAGYVAEDFLERLEE